MNILNDVFKLFGPYYEKKDNYRDSSGKGLFRRFIELLQEDILEHYYFAIKGMYNTLASYRYAEAKYFPLLEKDHLMFSPIGVTDAQRRKFLQYHDQVMDLKGTEYSYEIAMRILGFEIKPRQVSGALTDGAFYWVGGIASGLVTISVDGGPDTDIEANTYFFAEPDTVIVSVTGCWLSRETTRDLPYMDGTLDDPDRTFDSPTQTFDSAPSGCTKYDVLLYGNQALTPQLIRAIYLAIKEVEPINADLRYVKYNGAIVVDTIIQLYIDEFGDLIFVNDADPDLLFSIVDGDLYVDGIRATFYAVDINGDLVYIE